MTEVLSGKKFECAFCGGTGVQPRSLKSRCLPCRGKGEVEFNGPAITCTSCKGKGKSPGVLGLACIRCKGVGVMEKSAEGGGVAEVIGKRLGEIIKRLQWTRKETKKRTKEVEKRLKPIKPFVKELKKEAQWPEELGNKIKKGWQSLWED